VILPICSLVFKASSAGAMLGIPHQYQTIDLTYPYLFDKYKTHTRNKTEVEIEKKSQRRTGPQSTF
jgi:hypothetical protein